MAAYVLVDMDVTDQGRIVEYRRLAEESLSVYGGRYLARGGASEVLEGDWVPHRVVVVEFPDADAARRWYTSAEYAAARAARDGAASASFILVEGVAP